MNCFNIWGDEKNMKKRRECIIIAILTLLSLYLSIVGVVASEDPTVLVNPEKPARKSSVTFTAEFDDSDIQNVYLKYNECNDEICYSLYNKSMTSIGDNKFEVDITLVKDDATYIQYWLEVESTDGWSNYLEISNVYLSTGSGGDSNGSPGFEFLLVALSVMLIVVVFKRKRMK